MSSKIAILAALCVGVASAENMFTEEFKQRLMKEADFELDFKHFESWTVAEAKKLFGTQLVENDHLPVADYSKIAQFVSIPDSFDATTQWPNCIHPIRNQMQCGSCWAFSASEVLSDRTCIASNGATNVVLSPQDMVSCDSSDNGCSGGQLANAWTYLEKTGIVADSCLPYSSGAGNSGSCPNKCTGSGSWTKYQAKSGSSVKLANEQSIQLSLMTYGPVQTGFYVYKSFMAYKSGVYQKAWYELIPEGGHAVKIVGWGVEDGKKYWRVANSWDTTWGEQGYFKIIRGSNSCDFESQAYSGQAAV